MAIGSQMIEDFNINTARILVSGAVAIIDNVKKIIIMSENNVTVDYGKGQVSIYGKDIVVESIYDSRVCLKGVFSGVDFSGIIETKLESSRY